MENYPLDPSLCIMLFVKHFCVLPITMPGGGIQLHLPKQNKNFRFETFIPKIGLYKFKRASKQIGTIHKNAICYFFGGERRIIGESPKNCHACPPLEVPLNAHFFQYLTFFIAFLEVLDSSKHCKRHNKTRSFS